ncbi:MAG: hypothetical protein E6805_16655 [Citrobacter freundii]|uniref:hypothetical protein n=1 Tax=Citrobacter freundii complex TaxID=1344959 RepID=UPI000B5405A8|nr:MULTISPECIES: hypothetical protein [Citrobacter freundii complex]MDU7722539.1 hypothetical protein [Citrobacter sp.]ASG44808.1 hypothetical protein CES93_14755 [Citrobacter freundii]MDT7322934.1 hypothetical protein [Citrobacter freundii]MDU1358499.1 hypothetical protein [Citrobacter freundii]MDU1700483.1 hypothetical protein [Citrobacter freundii]
MATVTEIRAKLRAGEVVIMPGNSVFLFMRECERHPEGDECYHIEPHSHGYSKVFDPKRAKGAHHDN